MMRDIDEFAAQFVRNFADSLGTAAKQVDNAQPFRLCQSFEQIGASTWLQRIFRHDDLNVENGQEAASSMIVRAHSSVNRAVFPAF